MTCAARWRDPGDGRGAGGRSSRGRALRRGLTGNPLRESDRLARVIEDLFELSGVHAGALVVRPRKVALQEVVDEVVQAA